MYYHNKKRCITHKVVIILTSNIIFRKDNISKEVSYKNNYLPYFTINGLPWMQFIKCSFDVLYDKLKNSVIMSKL